MAKVMTTEEESSLPSERRSSIMRSNSRSPLSALGRSFSKKGSWKRGGGRFDESGGGVVGRGGAGSGGFGGGVVGGKGLCSL